MEDHIELNRSSVPTPFDDQAKRKAAAAGVKTWLVVPKSGSSGYVEMGKQLIIRRTGIPPQDLRVIEAELGYPSAILRRERAIVVNLDQHVKAIITANEILVPNPKDPYIASFACDLQLKLSDFCATTGSDGSPEASPEMSDRGNYSKPSPFEFTALEVCLESVCTSLESETSAFEEEAYPALDELSAKTTTRNLKRVRVLKGRLIALIERVQKVRDEFEHLLDDDADMAQMYLTDYKLATIESEGLVVKEDFENDAYALESGDNRDEDENCKSSTPFVSDLKPNVEELEMILEAYFVQVDGILNKLSTISEYIHNTQAYINIVLDDKQNQLLRTIVMIATGNLFLDMANVTGGLLGMNVGIELFSTGTQLQWYEAAGGMTAAVIGLYCIAISMLKWRGLLG